MPRRWWVMGVMIGLLLVGRLAWAQTTALAPLRQISTVPLDVVAISADGLRLVSGGRDNILRLWDTTSGAFVGQFTGHSGWITRVAISQDGRSILSGSQDTTVRLWDSSTFTQRVSFTHHTASVTGVAFSPDGQLMATTGLDGVIWLGEASTGRELARLPGFEQGVWSVAFSPDGRRLATGSADGAIWLWGLYDSSVTRLSGHSGAVTGLAFDVTGTRLVSSSWDRTARVWDVTSSPPNAGTPLLALVGHYGPVMGAGFSGRGIITASLDGTARVWGSQGQTLATLQGSALTLGGLAISPDGQWVTTAGIDGLLESWDLAAITLAEAPVEVAMLPTTDPNAVPTSAVYPGLPIYTAQPAPTRIPVTAAPALQSVTGQATPVPPSQPAMTLPTSGTIISLPTVNVFAPITLFPLDGVSWAIDPWERRVGHLQGTAWFDAPGNVVLGGHSEYPNGSPGIFKGLYQLNPGDPIIISIDGNERRYLVTQKFSVRYDDLTVVYPSSDSRLTLITCDIPSFNATTQTYDDRLVVVAVPG